MHMKFEIEIPKQTWVTLHKPCSLQTDGQADKVTPAYPRPTSLVVVVVCVCVYVRVCVGGGGGYNESWRDKRRCFVQTIIYDA